MKQPLSSYASSKAGQSTVEFILSMILLMSLVLFYFQLSMIFAFGSFVHYATFMSARAYLAAGPDPSDQKARAKAVIVKMLKKSSGQAGVDKFPSIAKGFGSGDPTGFQVDRPPQFQKTNIDFSWLEGVRYTFRGRLFLLPLGRSLTASQNRLELTSESWLGREPTAQECQDDMGKAKDGWIFDNGC